MAPEVFVKKNVGASPALDIWALGCILYALVVGRIPFNDKTDRDLKQKIIEMDPQFPPEILLSAEIKDLISHMLTKNPEHRATLYDIMEHPWYRGKKFDAHNRPMAPQMEAISEEDEKGLGGVERVKTKVKFAAEPEKPKRVPGYMRGLKKNAKQGGRGRKSSRSGKRGKRKIKGVLKSSSNRVAGGEGGRGRKSVVNGSRRKKS